jgi:Peptidase family S41
MISRIFLFLSIVVIQSASAQTLYDPMKQIPVSLLKSDFRFLRLKLETVHPALYRYTSKVKMDLLFDSLNHSINEPLNEQQFLSLIQLLSEKIKDGHTMFLPGKELSKYDKNEGRFFPFSTSWIENKLVITENLSADPSIQAGTEIVSINGIDTKYFMQDLMRRQIRDGYSLTYPYWILSKYFAPYYSFAFGRPSTFIIGLKPNKAEILKNITALTIAEMQANQLARYKHKQTTIGIQFKTTNKPSTALVSIQSFEPDNFELAGQSNYKKAIGKIFLRLRKDSISHLVLDLRDNQGGEFEPVRVLLSYLIEKPCQFLVGGPESELIQPNRNHFKGRIDILMNGGSFSATSILIATLQREHRVILIGEETGGNQYEISGDAKLFILPSTNIHCMISTKNYRILSGINEGHGVLPDYCVKPTINDLYSKKDPVLAYVLAFQ